MAVFQCISMCLLFGTSVSVTVFDTATYSLPLSMYGFGSGFHNGTLTIMNGYASGYFIPGVYEIELSSPATAITGWTERTIPTPFSSVIRFDGQTTIQVGALVYGTMPWMQTNDYQNLLSYDLQSHQYANISSYAYFTPAKILYPCTVHNSAASVLYIFGDRTSLQYNTSSDVWSYIAQMRVTRYWSGCAMFEPSQRAFVFGGFSNGPRDSIEVYDVAADSFEILPATLAEAKSRFSCILFSTFDNRIYCVGGYDSSTTIKTVERFNPIDETMDGSRSFELAVGRYWHVLVLIDRCLMVMGGSNGGTLNSVEYFCAHPTSAPTYFPTQQPSQPSSAPSVFPSQSPTTDPSGSPSADPTQWPSAHPTTDPSQPPSANPSQTPSVNPSQPPSQPSRTPSVHPSRAPSQQPSHAPSQPTQAPTQSPTGMTVFGLAALTLPLPMYGIGHHFANGSLIIFSGFTTVAGAPILSSYQLQISSATDILLSTTAGAWDEQALASPFGSGIVGFPHLPMPVGSLVYAAMPYLTVHSHQALLIFDVLTRQYVNTSSYASLAPQLLERACAVFNSVANTLYTFGGYDGSVIQPTCLQYNITADLWSTIADLNDGWYDGGCAMYEPLQRAFVFGGADVGWAYHDTIQMYDVALNSFTTLPVTLNETKGTIPCILFTDQIFCIGGGDFVKTVEILNPRSLTIDASSYQLLVGRRFSNLFVLDDCLFVLGGENRTNVLTTDIEYLCTRTATPSQSPSSYPTSLPSFFPSRAPTRFPTANPSQPSQPPSFHPSQLPSVDPTQMPSRSPTLFPSANPSQPPTFQPSQLPSVNPTPMPSLYPTTSNPSTPPSQTPSAVPTQQPSQGSDQAGGSSKTRMAGWVICCMAMAAIAIALPVS